MSRRHRRLPEEILIAFHQACDQADLDIADQLIRVLETVIRRPDYVKDRRGEEGVAGAYRRLWDLRHGMVRPPEKFIPSQGARILLRLYD